MYNFLCVGGDKYGCGGFSAGSNGKIVSVEEALDDIDIPLCWAGSHKETLFRHCIENNRKFYNLDTGYFGNTKRKEVVRVSINNLQDQGPIRSRPADRLDMFNINLVNYRRGSSIVIVPPDEKISKVFKLADSWVDDVTQELKKYTDRPIKIRSRPAARRDRIDADTFNKFIEQDTFVVIGYSSNALVESIMCGIPVISLGHSATKSLMNYNLKDIEQVPNVEDQLRDRWLCHLSYKQFTHEELLNGTAWNLLSTES
jgi:hypothetical protein